jgi:hypothetical protein
LNSLSFKVCPRFDNKNQEYSKLFFYLLNISFVHKKNRPVFRQTMIRIRTERSQLRNTGVKVVKLPYVSMVGGGFLIFLPWRPVLRFQRPLRGRIPNHRIRLGDPIKIRIVCRAKKLPEPRYQTRQLTCILSKFKGSERAYGIRCTAQASALYPGPESIGSVDPVPPKQRK